jgi:Lrp/AsnC family leucine-responsive transcriptional regulator
MPFDATTQLDETDWRLLRELQQDARLSYAELGRTVNLSRPAVADRMKRLEGLGIIVGYRAEINLARLGYGIHAFVRINAQGDVSDLLTTVRGTGADSFILRVAVASLWQLENVLDKFMRYGTVTASVVLSSVLTKRIVTDGIETRFGFEHGAGI